MRDIDIQVHEVLAASGLAAQRLLPSQRDPAPCWRARTRRSYGTLHLKGHGTKRLVSLS
jgi:hypothetical protein